LRSPIGSISVPASCELDKSSHSFYCVKFTPATVLMSWSPIMWYTAKHILVYEKGSSPIHSVAIDTRILS
jgi:hypothetical protein